MAEPSLMEAYSKKQGDFTIDDYYRLREDMRIELIDGVIYDMAAPANLHQLLAAKIFYHLKDYIRANKGNCIPMYAPTSVQIDCDDRSMLEPDILIVCDRMKLQGKVVCGAPDFVLEILSPSTRKKDIQLKFTKYWIAGVREYWVVDPDKKRVIVYDFETMNPQEVYTFEHKIPVKIFEGKCTIDFKEIFEYVEFLYNKQ